MVAEDCSREDGRDRHGQDFKRVPVFLLTLMVKYDYDYEISASPVRYDYLLELGLGIPGLGFSSLWSMEEWWIPSLWDTLEVIIA